MKAPPCEHCGRRDTSFTSLWLRAQRTIRNQRRTMRQLRHDHAVTKALAEHRKAQIADLEARCRRLDETLDYISRAKFAQIVKRNEGAT